MTRGRLAKRKGYEGVQEMVGSQVTVKLTDGSHVINDVTATLVAVDEFGVLLHKKYRNQLRVHFHPWQAVFMISPDPLPLRTAQLDDDED